MLRLECLYFLLGPSGNAIRLRKLGKLYPVGRIVGPESPPNAGAHRGRRGANSA